MTSMTALNTLPICAPENAAFQPSPSNSPVIPIALKVHALSSHLSATFTRTSSNLLDFIFISRLIRISEPYM